MKYIKELRATDNDIHILNESLLTDEEIGIAPTRRVSDTNLESWLRPGDSEEGFTGKEAIEYIRKKEEKKKPGELSKTGL